MTGSDAPDEGDGTAPTRVRDALIGVQLGEYVVEARLGDGGMGIVYRARHPIIGRAVAIKLLRPDMAGDGLLAEAQALASARHPHIIDIFGFGQAPSGQPYFVMELLEGHPLDEWLTQHRPTPLQTVSILKQLFSALAAAHAANVVHRDLKPANMFLVAMPDGGVFVKILDFGLAKRVDPNAPEFTRGRVGGTPLYMAPEQIRGQLTGPFTDLYAAGCVAWELVTGAPPFSAPALLELMELHLQAPTPPLPAGVPEGLTQLMTQLLEKAPEKRPGSAADAKKLLDRVERKLLVAAGTNVQLPQLDARATPAALTPARARVSEPPAKVKISAPPSHARTSGPLPSLPPAAGKTVASLGQEKPWRVRAAVLTLALTVVALALAVVLVPRPREETVQPPTLPQPAPTPPPQVADEPPASTEPPEPPVAPRDDARPKILTAPSMERRARQRLEKKLVQLEERVLLELVEDRQRMALKELKDLRKEAATAPPAQVRTMLREFEATWLTR